MTRINCIPVEELHDKHLLAEYRELPRVFKLARPFKHNESVPSEYTMGTGHVKFFYDKLLYLYNRQVSLVSEMQRRGFKPTHTNTEDLLYTCEHQHLYGDWKPCAGAQAINRERINERLTAMGVL